VNVSFSFLFFFFCSRCIYTIKCTSSRNKKKNEINSRTTTTSTTKWRLYIYTVRILHL
jgi:hypothetical protein